MESYTAREACGNLEKSVANTGEMQNFPIRIIENQTTSMAGCWKKSRENRDQQSG